MRPDVLTVVRQDLPDPHNAQYRDELVDLNGLTVSERKMLGEEQKRIAAQWQEEGVDWPFWLPGDNDVEQYKAAILACYASPFDDPASAAYHHYRGTRHAEDGYVISISIYGSWSGKHEKGGSLTSNELLGCHANTADLIRGWIDGGASIIDYRRIEGRRTCSCRPGHSLKATELIYGTCPHCGKDALPLL